MGASSVTGTGLGAANKPTGPELEIIAQGPAILFAGTADSVSGGGIESPPADGNNVVFPYRLPGPSTDYAILLTSINAGTAYVASIDEDDDGNLTGFHFVCEAEGTVSYLVCRNGARNNVRL